MPTSWVTLAAALESPQGSTSYALLVLLLLLAASLWLLQRAKPHRLARSMIFTLAVLMALQAGLPPLDFGNVKGRKRREYFAAVWSGLEKDYGRMEKVFSDVIRRTLGARSR